jgi:hypothetical protein
MHGSISWLLIMQVAMLDNQQCRTMNRGPVWTSNNGQRYGLDPYCEISVVIFGLLWSSPMLWCEVGCSCSSFERKYADSETDTWPQAQYIMHISMNAEVSLNIVFARQPTLAIANRPRSWLRSMESEKGTYLPTYLTWP